MKRGTYIVGVMNVAFCDDDGVEKELLTEFQRFARYPGVDVPETREDAEFARDIASKVRNAARKFLNL